MSQGSIRGPLLFLRFINDLPKIMQKIESYCYADDFKVITGNQTDMNKSAETIQKRPETNNMKLITKKSHKLNIKGIKAEIGEKDLESVKSQRDRGLIIQQNLIWNDNCHCRSRKEMSALFQI